MQNLTEEIVTDVSSPQKDLAKMRQRLYSESKEVSSDFAEMPIIDLDIFLQAALGLNQNEP